MTNGEAAAWAQAAFSFVGVVVTIWIAWRVDRYTRRRDKAEIVHSMWQIQQELNIQTIGSDAHLNASELMVYGGNPKNETESGRLMFQLFFMINRVRHLYDAFKLGIFDSDEFERHARPTLSLVAAHKERVYALLDSRGYDPDFAATVMRLLTFVEAPRRPDLATT